MNPNDLLKSTIEPASTAGFSFIELFVNASLTVQIVMVGLLIASIWSWAIIIEKLFAFRQAQRQHQRYQSHTYEGCPLIPRGC